MESSFDQWALGAFTPEFANSDRISLDNVEHGTLGKVVAKLKPVKKSVESSNQVGVSSVVRDCEELHELLHAILDDPCLAPRKCTLGDLAKGKFTSPLYESEIHVARVSVLCTITCLVSFGYTNNSACLVV